MKPDSCRRPSPQQPQKPPKVELQTELRACVYYVRGGFHPEKCTGCFSGPDRVNSSSCALPAGEACICACVCARVCASSCIHGPRLYLCACLQAVGVEPTEKDTLSSAQVITCCRPFIKNRRGKTSGWLNQGREGCCTGWRDRESD